MRWHDMRKNGLNHFIKAMTASVFSNIGSQMTAFALIAWAYETTGSASMAGILGTADYGSMIIGSIFAGALADRWDRKKLLIGTGLVEAGATVLVLVLSTLHILGIWGFIVYGTVIGLSGSIVFPAYLSGVMGMVSDEEKPRANGLFQTGYSITVLLAPPVSGFLLSIIGLKGILIVDLISYVVVIFTTLGLPIPKLKDREKKPILKETIDGFNYLATHKAVIGSVIALTSINVAFGAYEGLYRPLLLAFTHHSESIAGLALASYGIGNLLSGVLMSIWKGPKNRVPLMLFAWAFMSLFGFVIGGLGRSLPIWIIGGFGQGVMNNIAIILTMGIWQSNIEPEYQGRAFGIFKLISQVTIPLSMFMATQVADHWAEPALKAGGELSSVLGPVFGTATGSGISLVLVTLGAVFGVLVPLILYAIPQVRRQDIKHLLKKAS